ncbi:MAG: hypothetical protein Kapaf2KO_08210 [Candidatus Kapaibacteriales bacterium]
MAQESEKIPDMYEFIAVEEVPEPDYEIIQSNIVYPKIARKAGIEGLVVVKVLVDMEGKVKKAEVLKSDNTILDEAAVDAIMRSNAAFKPSLQNGVPIMTWQTVPVKFILEEEDIMYDTVDIGTITTPINEKTNKERKPKYEKQEMTLETINRASTEPQAEGGDGEFYGEGFDIIEMEEEKQDYFYYSIYSDEELEYSEDEIPSPDDFQIMDEQVNPNFAAINKNIVYPDDLEKEDMKGIVYMYILVGKKGEVVRASPIERVSTPNPVLGLLAFEAIMKSEKEFEIGYSGGKPVLYWVSVPFRFNPDKD